MGARVTDLRTEEFHGEQGNVAIETVSVDQMTQWLETGRPFAFSHYGDGELQAIMAMPGGSGDNLIDGYRYTPRLVRELRNTVLTPHARPYCYGISPAAFRLNAKGAAEKAIEMYAPSVSWCDGQALARASARGELHGFIEALGKYHIIYVGPAHVRKALSGALTIDEFIEVPLRNANALVADVIMQLIMALGYGPFKADTLIGFSAGALSNIVMHTLWTSYWGLTMIDFGSMWDPYAGLMTRSYFRMVEDWPAVIHRNLYGE